MSQLILTGARVILVDDVITGTVVGIIRGVAAGRRMLSATVDSMVTLMSGLLGTPLPR